MFSYEKAYFARSLPPPFTSPWLIIKSTCHFSLRCARARWHVFMKWSVKRRKQFCAFSMSERSPFRDERDSEIGVKLRKIIQEFLKLMATLGPMGPSNSVPWRLPATDPTHARTQSRTTRLRCRPSSTNFPVPTSCHRRHRHRMGQIFDGGLGHGRDRKYK